MEDFDFKHEDFSNDPEYFEEFAIIWAQQRICDLMAEKGISKAELARLLHKPKSFVSRLLSDGQNLTVRTYGRVLFFLGESAVFESKKLVKPEVNSWVVPFNSPSTNLNINHQVCRDEAGLTA